MKIDILTLFPEMFAPLEESIIGRAVKNGKLEINLHDIRKYSQDKHKKCDDYPFGGGAGMIMMPQPIASAIEAIDPNREARRIYVSPRGKTFGQREAERLIGYERLLILCGHYEGVDERVIELFIDEEISIGDYVLTGGELPAMVITDCVARLLDGVLGEGSLKDESFTDGLLEYPQYTRPREFMGKCVPDVLITGDHAKIDAWRREKSREVTAGRRPDMLKKE